MAHRYTAELLYGSGFGCQGPGPVRQLEGWTGTTMAKTATHRVLLLRSGATEWDLAGRVQGSTDLPLSELGLSDITRTVQELGHPPLSSVCCASDEASISSAEVLAAAAGVKVVVVPDFQEMAFGLWEGVLKTTLEDRFCRAVRLWGEDPACVTPPEGESLVDFSARLIPALRRVLTKARSSGRRSTATLPSVGVVLRPVGEALMRCILSGLPTSEVQAIVRERPAPLWIDTDIESDWALPSGVRRPASVSAA